jgi:hypothetical protein
MAARNSPLKAEKIKQKALIIGPLPQPPPDLTDLPAGVYL